MEISDKEKTKACETAIRKLKEVASAKTREQHLNHVAYRIAFSKKVELLESYYFLRDYTALKDLDEAVDEIRKCLLVGEKRIREESKKWLDSNNDYLDIHQALRKDIESARLVSQILGESHTVLYDAGVIDTFRKEREKRIDEEIKCGFLKIGYEKKKQAYYQKTEDAVDYLRNIQDSFLKYRKTVEKDYEDLSRNEFFAKYSYNIHLDRF